MENIIKEMKRDVVLFGSDLYQDYDISDNWELVLSCEDEIFLNIYIVNYSSNISNFFTIGKKDFLKMALNNIGDKINEAIFYAY